MSEDLYDTLKATAMGMVKGYESPNPWSVPYRTDDMTHWLHPTQSIPSPYNEVIRKDGLIGALQFFGAALDKFTVDIEDTFVDVKQRTVVLTLTANFDFKAIGEEEPAEKGYLVEYIWMLQMTEDGKKIANLSEFIDVERVMGYVRGKAIRYAQANGGGSH